VLGRFQLLDTPGLAQQEILDDELAVAPSKRGAASATRYLAIDGLRPGFDFDDVIECIAVRALNDCLPVGMKRLTLVLGFWLTIPDPNLQGRLLSRNATRLSHRASG